jgi:hypothetical protein
LNKKSLVIGLALVCMIALGSSTAVVAEMPSADPTASLLAEDLQGATGAGSAIGPGGMLYIAEGIAGRISRVDPQTGDVTTFASGLPAALPGFPIGGPMDVAFIGGTAYALVTLVGTDIGGNDVVGIYRVDGPNSFTVVADVGQYSWDNPPTTEFDIPTGVQYALEAYRGGFLVTDGHHNRVLWVTLDGEVSELIAFGDVVPTGLAVSGNTIYMAEAGETPHLPAEGKVVSLGPNSSTATEIASGARLAVDVEFGRGRKLYALSQGIWDGAFPGSPAMPETGALLEVKGDGTVTAILEGLDRPTSMEFIGNTAYVVTLGGEVWKIDDVSGPPYGIWR